MRVVGSALPLSWPAVTTLARRFGPCRRSEEDRGPDQTAVKPWSPWQPDPAYARAAAGLELESRAAHGRRRCLNAVTAGRRLPSTCCQVRVDRSPGRTAGDPAGRRFPAGATL